MSKNLQSVLLSSALAGLVAGAVACGDTTKTETQPAAGEHAKEHPVPVAEQPTDIPAHECRGKNECKGQGGCHVEGQNTCKGKNPCKGKGGCKVG